MELCISRLALGVSKVNHALRAYGAELWDEGVCLERFDERRATLTIIIPGLNEQRYRQTALGASL